MPAITSTGLGLQTTACTAFRRRLNELAREREVGLIPTVIKALDGSAVQLVSSLSIS